MSSSAFSAEPDYTMPHRIGNLIAAMSPPYNIEPWYIIVPQVIGAAALSAWAQMDAIWHAVAVSMFLDWVMGSWAAHQRGEFKFRVCGNGFFQKIIAMGLCACVMWIFRTVGAPVWVCNMSLSGFVLIDLSSALRHARRAKVRLAPGMGQALRHLDRFLRAESKPR